MKNSEEKIGIVLRNDVFIYLFFLSSAAKWSLDSRSYLTGGVFQVRVGLGK